MFCSNDETLIHFSFFIFHFAFFIICYVLDIKWPERRISFNERNT